MTISLLFPHQLFKNNPVISSDRDLYLYEDPLFFNQYSFHKNKLILHRASMRYASSYYTQQGITVHYISLAEHSSLKSLFQYFHDIEVKDIQLFVPEDYLLERRLTRYAEEHAITLNFYQSPMFLLSQKEMRDKLGDKGQFFMASFYKKQRQDMDVLMDNGEPVGGKWSYDEENRKKLPKDLNLPEQYVPQQNEYVKEAIDYVNEHFKENPGDTEHFIYPVTYYQAEKWLDKFLENKMQYFGDYEDALSDKDPFLFHSVLTPALNIGLITPEQILRRTLEMHAKRDFPLNSLEGFIRQIIGWREFMRGVYDKVGVSQRTKNHFDHTRSIPPSFWTGKTGILPVDDVIRKVRTYGYCHHIERLMVLGNFMLLCEFDPDEVYRWFMELFVDSYDWVMVPNVYGMVMYADGGLITTKPYISGSNYIRKMSHYKKDSWCEVWDGLYWRFLHVHRTELSKNHRMNMVMSLLERMPKDKLNSHLENADNFLENRLV